MPGSIKSSRMPFYTYMRFNLMWFYKPLILNNSIHVLCDFVLPDNYDKCFHVHA